MIESVNLRRLQNNDAVALSLLANNKNISNYLRDYFPNPYHLSDANFFIDLIKKENPIQTFGIDFQEKLVGIISINKQTDVYQKNGELGYWIGEAFWYKGIATKSIELILEYGFNQLRLERIFANIFSNNKYSMKVLEKNNFTKEGVFKNTIFKNGELLDDHQYSILRNDYFSK